MQWKHSDISEGVKFLFSTEPMSTDIQYIVISEVKNTTTTKVKFLEKQNTYHFLKSNDPEQSSRKPLIRVSGIPETSNENTADRIVDAFPQLTSLSSGI